jgi:hypothetical protein
MDILQSIRISTIPKYLRLIIFSIGAGVIGFNIYVIIVGFDGKEFWVAAGAQLLAVLLPFTVVMLYLGFAHGGHAALKDRTENLLIEVLPGELINLSEGNEGDFYAYNKKGKLAKLFGASAMKYQKDSCVEISYLFEEGDCHAEYLVKVPFDLKRHSERVALRFRVEVNVKNVNIVLWFAKKDNVEKFIETVNCDSSVEGESKEEATLRNAVGGAQSAGYVVNKDPTSREFKEGNSKEENFGLVLSRSFSDDFLWNPAEQLFFCQDLVFFLRTLVIGGTNRATKNTIFGF